MAKKLIRFDWAMKKMLCHKANFDILEGFLSEKDRKAYDKYLQHLMSIASRNHTIEIEAKEIIKKAKEESDIHYIVEMYKEGFSISQIAKISKKSESEVRQILDSQANK